MVDSRRSFVFALSALVFFGGFFAMAAYRQGWFSPVDSFYVSLSSAEGLTVGTPVLISGLRAGHLQKINLSPDEGIQIELRVLRRYAKFLREDAKVSIYRPYLVGEKIINLNPGHSAVPLVAGTQLRGEQSLELVDFLRGDRVSPYLLSLQKLLDQLQSLSSPKDQNLVELYRQAFTSLKSLEKVAGELKSIRSELVTNPKMQQLLADLAASSGDLKAILKQGNGVIPQLNKTMGETVFTLQALQRSFLLRGGVEKLEKEQKIRAPANVDSN